MVTPGCTEAFNWVPSPASLWAGKKVKGHGLKTRAAPPALSDLERRGRMGRDGRGEALALIKMLSQPSYSTLHVNKCKIFFRDSVARSGS